MHHLAVSCTHLACALPGRPPSRPRALKSSGPRHRPWVLAILQTVLDSFGNHPALRSLDSERPLRGRTRPSDPIAHSASTAMRMASSVVKRMPSSAASASPYAWRPEAASTVSKAASRTTSKKVRPTKKALRGFWWVARARTDGPENPERLLGLPSCGHAVTDHGGC